MLVFVEAAVSSGSTQILAFCLQKLPSLTSFALNSEQKPEISSE